MYRGGEAGDFSAGLVPSRGECVAVPCWSPASFAGPGPAILRFFVEAVVNLGAYLELWGLHGQAEVGGENA